VKDQQNNSQNYGFVYFNLYVPGQQAGWQKTLNRKVITDTTLQILQKYISWDLLLNVFLTAAPTGTTCRNIHNLFIFLPKWEYVARVHACTHARTHTHTISTLSWVSSISWNSSMKIMESTVITGQASRAAARDTNYKGC
jgi:hypothetical protein